LPLEVVEAHIRAAARERDGERALRQSVDGSQALRREPAGRVALAEGEHRLAIDRLRSVEGQSPAAQVEAGDRAPPA
jgi:hypothetical protein